MDSMFELFDISVPEKQETKSKKEKKPNVEIKRKLPLVVYTGFLKPIELEHTMFNKEEPTEDEIFSYLEEINPMFSKKLMQLNFEDQKGYLILRPENHVAKGTITITDDTKMYNAGKEVGNRNCTKREYKSGNKCVRVKEICIKADFHF